MMSECDQRARRVIAFLASMLLIDSWAITAVAGDAMLQVSMPADVAARVRATRATLGLDVGVTQEAKRCTSEHECHSAMGTRASR